MRDEEHYQHPTQGQISFSRVQSGGRNKFYGSDLPVDNYIEVVISESKMTRTLTHDSFYPSKRIMKLSLTPNAFAELLTSMNTSGVPCTIDIREGQWLEKPENPESRKESTERQFKNRMLEIGKTLANYNKDAKRLIAKKTLSANDQKELNGILDFAIREITQNLPYIETCFQETMDKVVTEAKSEVEAAIQHKINVLGLQALYNENKLLENKPNEE